MTARELIAALQALPKHQLDLQAYTEGCDCSGPASGVSIVKGWGKDPDVVLVKREEGS